MNAVRSFVLLSTLPLAVAADLDGPAIYKQRCALCHDKSSETRAPAPAAMRLMSPENILRALETGLMKDQGAAMPAAERKIIAEHLSGRAIGAGAAEAKAGLCADPKASYSLAGSSWNGWGADLANTRFQTAAQAGFTADQVPRLKLKWVFGYPNTFSSNGAPTLAGGRIFVPSANRNIYSLDAKTGCVYWSMETQAPVRTAITVASVATGERTRQVAFFGDQRGFAYGVDAASGELLWKVRIDEHARSKIVGAPVYHDARVYVPITAGEEGSAMSPAYECCSGRGGLVALEAATGKQIWRTYTIEETPRPTKKSATGGQLWGPSGASIWSAVTIDAERKIVYAGTGDNFSEPATKTSDAVVAFDMGTGKILWVKQLTENDTYNMACGQGAAKANCPDQAGPDVDIGASPILVKLANGKRVLLISQKNGVAHGLDADNKGAILWQTRVGRGGTLGGIQWGSASDGKNMYVALSDITFKEKSYGAGGRRVLDPKGGGGLFALDVATGKQVWSAPPPDCGDRPNCSPSQSAAIAMIPGVVFSGSVDAHIRGYSTRDGKVVWDFDTAQEFQTVNGLKAKGGSMDGPGPIIAGGMLYVPSGYGSWGGLPGNVLLAFSVDGK